MLKKTIKYKTFDGEDAEDTYYFHISEPEIVDLDVEFKGGFGRMITKLAETNDERELIEMFKRIIRLSIGEKSADGKQFKKSQEIVDDFVSSAAYVALFLELGRDDDAAANFVKGILPAEVVQAMADEGKLPQKRDQDKPEGPPPSRSPLPPTSA